MRAKETIAAALLTGCLLAMGLPARVGAQAHFLRGDANHDRALGVSDAVFTLAFLLAGGPSPPCRDAADFNDSGFLGLADAVGTLEWLFSGGPPPAAPYPVFEADPTGDDLDCLGPPVVLEGDITEDLTLTRGSVYLLRSGVFVREPATVRIEAGTTLLGESRTSAILVLERGARLEAVGTPTHPVVFTSDRPVGSRRRGDWGGVVFLGRGDNNLPLKENLAEGLSSLHWGGGVNVIVGDDSGRLSYVRIEYAGAEIAPDVELSGLSLFAVGSGTQLDHIQVKHGLDDGFEFYGGHCDLKYAVATGIADDSFDYSFGWRGRGQFWVAQQHAGAANRGIEADNSEDEFVARPRTVPIIANATLIGAPAEDGTTGPGSDTGILLRRGSGSVIYNSVIAGFNEAGLDLDGLETREHDAGELIVDHCVFWRNSECFETGDCESTECPLPAPCDFGDCGIAFTTVEFGAALNPHNICDPARSPIADPFDLVEPDFRPRDSALEDPFPIHELDPFFDEAPYRGAAPPAGLDWTREAWISYLEN